MCTQPPLASPLPDELPTHEFIGRWSLCKQIYLPRVNGSELEILPYHRSNLRTGAFSIQEPQGSDVIPPGQMELIVVPGVAFDLEGNRVGRGKGFYDRLLTETHATTIGVAFDFQLLCSVPAEAHDRPLDEIITERRRLTIRK